LLTFFNDLQPATHHLHPVYPSPSPHASKTSLLPQKLTAGVWSNPW
jgi:hypothetical protein